MTEHKKKTPPLSPAAQKALKEHGILDKIKSGEWDGRRLVGLIQILLPLLLKFGGAAGAAAAPVDAAARQAEFAAFGLDYAAFSGLNAKKILALIKALLAAVEQSGILDGSGGTTPTGVPSE